MKELAIETLESIRLIRTVLEDKKAENVVILDVSKVSTITDYYVICTGNNSRHLKALIEECDTTMSKAKSEPYRKSGTPERDWMILDYVHFVIHAFGEKAREHYALEALWKDAPQIK